MKINDYSSLGGPENGVYFRGRLTNVKHIKLPVEWLGVVNEETITVCITPIGAHQDIIVKGVQGGKVQLQSKPGLPIDCYYHVFAEKLL